MHYDIIAVTPVDWLEFGRTFGFPALILLGLAYFVGFHVWPLVTKQLEQTAVDRRNELTTFVNALEKRDQVLKEINDRNVTHMHAMTSQMAALTESVNRLRERLDRDVRKPRDAQ